MPKQSRFTRKSETASLRNARSDRLFLSIFHVARSVLVFIAILLVALLIITYVPELSLWLVS